jgi:hypothetical protein
MGPDHGLVPWAIVFLTGYLPALVVVLRHRGSPGLVLEPFAPTREVTA